MKKIFYLISSIKQNGPNQVLLNMIYGIDKKKYDIYVVSFLDANDQEFISKITSLGAKVIELNFKRKIDILLKGKRTLIGLLKKYKPTIIHSHGILPDIVNVKTRKKFSFAKRFTTIHNNMFEDYIYSFGHIQGRFYIKWHIHHLKKMDKCICCSKSSYEVLKEYLSNTTYVQNAIFKNEKSPINRSEIRKKIRDAYDIPTNAIVYIYIGTITERKNVANLVKYFFENRKKDEYLLVLGNGPMKEPLEIEYASKNIIFCGFCHNTNDYLIASDIYYSYSLAEGFSISVLEALQENNLLLLSDIPSHKEVFEIEKKVYLGEYFNANNFSKKKSIVYLKTKQKDTNEIKQFLIDNLSCKSMMDKYSKIYELEV